MNKKKNQMIKFMTKFLIVLCFIGVSLGIGIYEIGIDNILSGDVDAIYESVYDILNGSYDQSSKSLFGDNNEFNNVSNSVSGDFEIYVLDVGQAESILIKCDERYMLIDAGNNEDGKLIVEQLQKMGITSIDYLIGTHPHEDHIGGLDDIINNFNIKNLYMPARTNDSATYKAVINAADANNIDIITPILGYKFNLGEAICEIMAVDAIEDNNSCSIVLEITYGDNKFLFMADAESDVEDTRLWEDIDVLKVGHHGSSTSTSDDFLTQTLPELALISLGTGNTYGHPHQEIIEALNEYNVEVHRTDLEGTLHVVSNGTTYRVESLDIHVDGNKTK